MRTTIKEMKDDLIIAQFLLFNIPVILHMYLGIGFSINNNNVWRFYEHIANCNQIGYQNVNLSKYIIHQKIWCFFMDQITGYKSKLAISSHFNRKKLNQSQTIYETGWLVFYSFRIRNLHQFAVNNPSGK